MGRVAMASRLLVLATTLLLVAVSLDTPSLASGPAPARSPDLIRELYESGLARYLPASQEATEAPRTEAAITALPAWSRLVFFSFRNGVSWDLYLVYPTSQYEVRLTSEPYDEIYPALRGGADLAAFATDRDGDLEIYTVNVDGTDLLRLTNSDETDNSPAWSADGSRIAFQSYRTGNSELFAMNPDGSGLMQLTDSPAYDGLPSWSPDGTQIAFTSNRSGAYEIWIVNADGSLPQQVTATGYAEGPAWSPDGTKIAFSTDGNHSGWLDVWQVNPDGSDPEELWHSDYANTDLWGPSWSPDGAWLAMSETDWINYGGNWYWTRSQLRLGEVYGTGWISNLGDDRTWKAHWASTDVWPPVACTVSGQVEQRWSSFVLGWSAEDVGPAGIDGYEVQVRSSPAAPWQTFVSWSPSEGGLYQAGEVGTLEFRCRARDVAGNQAGWPDAPILTVTVDAAGPESHVYALPDYSRGTAFGVQWTGSDRGSGLAAYDVLVRDGTAGNWQVWQDEVTATSAQFTGSLGHTYSFRSQARDGVGHLEPWQPYPQAVTSLYSYVLTGTVTDQRGHTGLGPAFNLVPTGFFSPPDPTTGTYAFYLAQGGSYDLDVSEAGYGTLPPATLDIAQDTRLDLVLPPEDEVVVNGGFEAGSLDGWSVAGTGAQAAGLSRHTGAYGLRIDHAAPDSTVLSQTISVGAALHEPTLSLLVRIPSDLVGGAFAVRLTGPMSATLIETSAATPDWLHLWADLSTAAGMSATLSLELAGATGAVEVDEVSAGSWQTPMVEGVSPAEWLRGEAPPISIEGRNLVATPAVLLDGTALASVTWVSPTLLTAIAAPDLAPGPCDLTIANPNGAATTLAGAVMVTRHAAHMPIILRNRPAAPSPPGASWPTLGYDAGHTGRSGSDPGASRYAQVWTVDLGGAGWELESIAVADGVLVASTNAASGPAVVGLDAGTGSELWRRPTGGSFSTNPPSIAYGAVYYQRCNHYSDSYLYCLDLYTGAQRWQSAFGAQWEEYLAPLIVGDAVYINSGGYGGMSAHRAGNGEYLWFASLEQYDKWTPAYAGGTLYSCVEGTFRAHSPATGETQWMLDLGTCAWPYTIDTTPVLAGGMALVTCMDDLNAIDLSTHDLAWSVPGDFEFTIPAAADGVVYAIGGGTLQARKLTDGALLWSYPGDGALDNAPVVAGKYVYVASAAHTYVLERTTHATTWQVDHGGWLAVADGFLYIAQPDQAIYAYRAQEP